MEKEIQQLIHQLTNNQLNFSEVIDFIDQRYTYSPTSFKNGELINSMEQNQGSGKIFSFAKMHQLSKQETLLLFAEHYQAVLDDIRGSAHQNIRQFMQYGWDGIQLEIDALKPN